MSLEKQLLINHQDTKFTKEGKKIFWVEALPPKICLSSFLVPLVSWWLTLFLILIPSFGFTQILTGAGDALPSMNLPDGAKAAALGFSAFPDAPAAEAEILALWVFDIALAIRLRWPRPVPLIAAKILDPALRLPGAGRRPRPNDPAWGHDKIGATAYAKLDES